MSILTESVDPAVHEIWIVIESTCGWLKLKLGDVLRFTFFPKEKVLDIRNHFLQVIFTNFIPSPTRAIKKGCED